MTIYDGPNSGGKASFLLAMPPLKESLFTQSVILMAESNDSGALGFIINIPTGTLVKDALRIMDMDFNQTFDFPILYGGPVQNDFFWLIHSPEFTGKSTLKFNENYFLSSAIDIIPLLGEKDCPKIYSAGIGYSGWGENQLDREIEEGSWWLCDIDTEHLFSVPHKDRWQKAFELLGAHPEHLVDKTNPQAPSIN